MRFIETPVFTVAITSLLSDGEYRQLQLALLVRPEQGPVIRGSGGLRKLRWGARGHGKRGGVCIIYHWHPADDSVDCGGIVGKSAPLTRIPNGSCIVD